MANGFKKGNRRFRFEITYHLMVSDIMLPYARVKHAKQKKIQFNPGLNLDFILDGRIFKICGCEVMVGISDVNIIA